MPETQQNEAQTARVEPVKVQVHIEPNGESRPQEANREVVEAEVVDETEANEPVVDVFTQDLLVDDKAGENVILPDVQPPTGPDDRGTDSNDTKPPKLMSMSQPKEVRKMRKDDMLVERQQITGFTDEELATMLKNNGGFHSVVARKLKISVEAIGKRIRKSPMLQEVEADIKAGMTDLATNELVKAIKRGEAWAICFYLKCKAGWRENAEVLSTGESEGSRHITFSLIPIGSVEAAKANRQARVIEDGKVK